MFHVVSLEIKLHVYKIELHLRFNLLSNFGQELAERIRNYERPTAKDLVNNGENDTEAGSSSSAAEATTKTGATTNADSGVVDPNRVSIQSTE